MAMAAYGENRRYGWAEIQPRHWLTTAARIGLATVREDLLALAARAPTVVREVSAALPSSFPASVADAVFDGIQAAARRIAESIA